MDATSRATLTRNWETLWPALPVHLAILSLSQYCLLAWCTSFSSFIRHLLIPVSSCNSLSTFFTTTFFFHHLLPLPCTNVPGQVCNLWRSGLTVCRLTNPAALWNPEQALTPLSFHKFSDVTEASQQDKWCLFHDRLGYFCFLDSLAYSIWPLSHWPKPGGCHPHCWVAVDVNALMSHWHRHQANTCLPRGEWHVTMVDVTMNIIKQSLLLTWHKPWLAFYNQAHVTLNMTSGRSQDLDLSGLVEHAAAFCPNPPTPALPLHPSIPKQSTILMGKHCHLLMLIGICCNNYKNSIQRTIKCDNSTGAQQNRGQQLTKGNKKHE